MIDNKVANAVAKFYDGRITKVSKNSQQNDSETVANENDKKIPKERYIYLLKTDEKLLMN